MQCAEKVYQVVAKIPNGKVATYGMIAKLAGGLNPRAIGYFLHHNPDPKTIPCHRVVSAQGKLSRAYAFGGLSGHADQLVREGVIVKEGKVDLRAYVWNPHK